MTCKKQNGKKKKTLSLERKVEGGQHLLTDREPLFFLMGPGEEVEKVSRVFSGIPKTKGKGEGKRREKAFFLLPPLFLFLGARAAAQCQNGVTIASNGASFALLRC